MSHRASSDFNLLKFRGKTLRPCQSGESAGCSAVELSAEGGVGPGVPLLGCSSAG